MRVLGLDFGSKTCGVAVTDPLFLTAQGVEIIRRDKENHLRKTFRRIGELIEEYEVEAIVLGYPLNMDDTIGERAEKTLVFQGELEKRFQLPVYLCNEQLTTVEADETMELLGVKRENYKQYVDMIAATIILKDWMSEHGSDYLSDRGR